MKTCRASSALFFPVTLTLLGALSLTMGCGPAGGSSEAPPLQAHVEAMYFGIPEGGTLDASEMVAAQSAILEAISRSSEWAEADDTVRETLEQLPEQRRFIAEQFAAVALLRMPPLAQASSEREREAIAHYTTLLVENNSPEAGVIAEALEQLEGYWTEEQRSTVATRAAAAVEEHLDRQLDCTGCASVDLNARLDEMRMPLTQALRDKAVALDRLRAIATNASVD